MIESDRALRHGRSCALSCSVGISNGRPNITVVCPAAAHICAPGDLCQKDQKPEWNSDHLQGFCRPDIYASVRRLAMMMRVSELITYLLSIVR